LSEIRRNVKDRLEYQGRHQVKVILTNLISKCDYYLNEFDRKKLTLSNIIFTSNSETTTTTTKAYGNESMIENKITDNNNDDDEEPMSLSESVVDNEKNINNLETTFVNSSFLPSID
jgi:hypothetical protein